MYYLYFVLNKYPNCMVIGHKDAYLTNGNVHIITHKRNQPSKTMFISTIESLLCTQL